MPAMRLHGINRDRQAVGDSLARMATEHQLADIELPSGQRCPQSIKAICCWYLHPLLSFIRNALTHQGDDPWLDHGQSPHFLVRVTPMRTKGQAHQPLAIQLTVELDFISNDVEVEVALIVLRLFKTVGGYISQLYQAAAGSLAVYAVERVNQINAFQVILKQRVRPAAWRRGLGQKMRPPLLEEQRHPVVELEVIATCAVDTELLILPET